MNEEFLKEAKHFRKQVKWSAIACWVFTVVVLIMYQTGDHLRKDYSWVLVPFCGVILTLAYFNMDSHIKKYEELYSKDKKE